LIRKTIHHDSSFSSSARVSCAGHSIGKWGHRVDLFAQGHTGKYAHVRDGSPCRGRRSRAQWRYDVGSRTVYQGLLLHPICPIGTSSA
jgi:hypothetical protein